MFHIQDCMIIRRLISCLLKLQLSGLDVRAESERAQLTGHVNDPVHRTGGSVLDYEQSPICELSVLCRPAHETCKCSGLNFSSGLTGSE